MAWRRFENHVSILFAIACLMVSSLAVASEYRGQVTFGALPLPGATITATQGSRKLVAITDQQGHYSFPDLPDGTWRIEVEMLCFSKITQDVVVAPNAPAANWELKLLTLDQIKAQITLLDSGVTVTPPQVGAEPAAAPPDNHAPAMATPQNEDDLSQRAADGFLINGSVNNGAASPFAQLAAFGNNRNGAKGLYNGGIGITLDNSAWDARPFSLTGLNLPKATYNRITGVGTLGGPLKIPHVLGHGPVFFVAYQWMRSRDATTQAALVPDSSERNGDFSHEVNASGQPIQIFDPATGLPLPGEMIPVNAQAQALLHFYPLPNVAGNPRYNFQTPINSNTHQDALLSRFDKTVGHKNQIYGDFAFQSTRTSSPNLFGFLDTTDALGINSSIHWSHRFAQRLFLNLGYRYSRMATRITPYFADSENVSGEAGITGNNQDPMNWGPPSLVFAGGVAGLSDAESAFDRNQTSAWSGAILWSAIVTTSHLEGISAGRSSTTCPSKTRVAPLRSRAKLRKESSVVSPRAALILPIFCWEFPTQVPSRSATRINIFGNQFTTLTSRMIGE